MLISHLRKIIKAQLFNDSINFKIILGCFFLLRKSKFLSRQMLPIHHKTICRKLRTSSLSSKKNQDVWMRLSQDNGSRSTHCACRYLPLGPLVNCVKTYKFTIFDSKITFTVFHTPINVIEDRLDLYCHFLNDWWHNFCVKAEKCTTDCSMAPKHS